MTDETRRQVLKLFAAAGGTVGLAGSGVALASERSGDGDDGLVDDLMKGGVETARVRVGHLVPDAPPVDVYAFVPGHLDVGQVRLYRGLNYRSVVPEIPAGYTDVPAVEVGLRITPADDPETTVVEVPRLDLEDDTNYTVLAVGELAAEDDEPEPQALALVDNAGEDPPDYGISQLPESDETFVRFVHASPGADAVSVRSGSETLVDSATFGDATDYIEVDRECTLRLAAGGEPLATVTGDLRAGTRYTVYVADRTPDEEPTPDIQATVDSVAKPTLQANPGGE